jgi:hypothetical protein
MPRLRSLLGAFAVFAFAERTEPAPVGAKQLCTLQLGVELLPSGSLGVEDSGRKCDPAVSATPSA